MMLKQSCQEDKNQKLHRTGNDSLSILSTQARGSSWVDVSVDRATTEKEAFKAARYAGFV